MSGSFTKALFIATFTWCLLLDQSLGYKEQLCCPNSSTPFSIPKTPLSSNFYIRCSRSHLNTYTQQNQLPVSSFRQHVELWREQDLLSDLPRKPGRSLRHQERRSSTDELVQPEHQDNPSQACRLWQHPTAEQSVSCRVQVISTGPQAS